MKKTELSKHKPGISHVLSKIIEPTIISTRVIRTISGKSIEGMTATGLKAAVELVVKEKILYVSDLPERSTHIVELEFYKTAYVTLPKLIEGTSPEYLIKHRYLKTRVKVEDDSVKILDKRHIFNTFSLFLEFYSFPTYGLCYSLNKGEKSSLHIGFTDFSKRLNLTEGADFKALKPEWSPNGQDIAFLRDFNGAYMLCILDTKTLSYRMITDPSLVESVTSFSWSVDGLKIVFSALVDGCKEVFTINTKTGEHKRLTRGNSIINSRKPRISPDGRKIAFLKSRTGITDLYLMDICGLNCIDMTSSGNIKDFTWSKEGNSLLILSNMEGSADEVSLLQLSTHQSCKISGLSDICSKKSVKFSPDGRFISFVGSKFNTDNLYIYNVKDKKTTQITDNSSGMELPSYVWSIDSSRIYFVLNTSRSSGVYIVDMTSLSASQLKDMEGFEVSLSYRPRIK